MIKQIPLDRHPVYKRLKQKLIQEAATGRFLSFLDTVKGRLHTTDQLYAKNQAEKQQ